MLKQLYIKNYAIIDEVQIDFTDQLNIITGETGSGKSILLGALGLILGNRADSKAIQDQKKKCIVEATFQIKHLKLGHQLAELDLDSVDELVIRREISSQGKSRIFVNDSLATLKQVRGICSHLVDLHQQFENLGINSQSVQIEILDAMAGTKPQLTKYHEVYLEYQKVSTQLEEARNEQQRLVRERDYLQFQVAEFAAVEINEEEDSSLEDRVTQSEQGKDLRLALDEVTYTLSEEDDSITQRLKHLRSRLAEFRAFPQIIALAERLESVLIELADIESEVGEQVDATTIDSAELDAMQQRLDALNRLQHKHGVVSISDLVKVAETMQEKLSGLDALDHDIESYENRMKELKADLSKHADALTSKRSKAVAPFEKKVDQLLSELRMANSRFKVTLGQKDFGPSGRDDIQFLFAANKGSELLALRDTASGGELSRISLVIKSLIAEKIDLPTLLFDEIDSGVSGDVAKRMGEIFTSMAKRHQIISITHSPQVAARAKAHFKVAKISGNDSARSHIKHLSPLESIEEIAIMLSSSPPSKAALASARELVEGM